LALQTYRLTAVGEIGVQQKSVVYNKSTRKLQLGLLVAETPGENTFSIVGEEAWHNLDATLTYEVNTGRSKLIVFMVLSLGLLTNAQLPPLPPDFKMGVKAAACAIVVLGRYLWLIATSVTLLLPATEGMVGVPEAILAD